MKSKIRKGIPRGTLLSAGLLLGSLILSCGADKTDPAVKTLDELQNAKGLTITETGTGTARLTWAGTNGEEKFTGYNIYGAKVSTELQSALDKDEVAEGVALQLVDDAGEARDAAKAILQLMSYNGKDFEIPDTTKPTDDKVKFQYFPVYTKKDVFPTCIPTASTGTDAACVGLTEEGAKHPFFGTANYDVTGLVAGSKYCFFVLSTLDSGKTVAVTTTEMACITPMIHGTDLAVTIDATHKHQKIELNTTRAACTATSCPVTATVFADGESYCKNDATSADMLCLELVGTTPGLTGGQFVSINDLGYYAGGIADPTLPKMLPELTDYNSDVATIAYGGGYAISAQTLPIFQNHVYAVASRMDTSATPSSFHYDLFYAKSVSAAGIVNFEVRIAK